MKKIAAVLLALFFTAESRAVTITVTNNNDAGPGSLRQAVIDVNASVDPANKINFNISGGPVKITLVASMPTIIKQVIIDGTTQPGWAANAAAIALSCPTLITTGFSLGGPPSVIRGIRVQDFTNSLFNSTAIGLNTPGHTIADCQIISNFQGIVIHSASNTIGGIPASTNRNVLSGNVSHGVFITFGGGFNTLSGNLVGTDPTGTSAMPNGPFGATAGIFILSSSNNTIGGTQGAATRNIISGNNGNGVTISGASGGSDRNVVIGNYIGLDASGSGLIPNTGSGVLLGGGISNRVGGVGAGEANVLSGNVNAGVSIGSSTNVLFSIIQGNLIGTFPDGTTAPPLASSQDRGVSVQGGSNTLIGGTAAAARNVISGNQFYGIVIELSALNCTAQGNYIGVQSNGVVALSNGVNGVLIGKCTNAVLQGNVISGNGNNGIQVQLSNTVGTVIQGNFIGTDTSGTVKLPNGTATAQAGIMIDGVDGVLIGGNVASAGNVIAFNAGRGIAIVTNMPGRGVRNAILGNLIYSNDSFAIDLDINGVTANDVAPDADVGANNRQNFPVVTNVQQGSTGIQGILVSGASQTYRCEFFATNVPQGMIFLGATNITTPASGTTTFAVVLSGTAPTGVVVFGTATDGTGNTSEFGPGTLVKAAQDADGDGLWDNWENVNLGGTAFNGSADNDADGFNNYFEFVSDTQPTNANSFFRLVTLTNWPAPLPDMGIVGSPLVRRRILFQFDQFDVGQPR